MSTTYPDLTFTNFPESLDTFKTMLDIVAADATALKTYQQAMENGNITQANNALSGMQNANQKIMTAVDINKITNAVQALQRFYNSDIVPYINSLQSEWSAQVNSLAYLGSYSTSTTYKKNNIVLYSPDGNVNYYLYLCIQNAPSSNIAPTNTTYWRQLTMVGMRGESGTNLSYNGEYDNATEYVAQDLVTYNGVLYVATQTSTNKTPSENVVTYWEVVMALSSRIYPVQWSQPSNQQVGEFWFQVLWSDV